MHMVMHDFYYLLPPRQILGNAVVWERFAPLQLHCQTCHAEINTWCINAPSEGNQGGGGVSLQYWQVIASPGPKLEFWFCF
jgi:hypothetical protein